MFVNLFRSRAIEDMTSFSLAKEFYFVLASTFQLQYGNILLATSSKSEIQTAITNNWPFFTNNTDLVKRCLKDDDVDCDELQDILQRLGITCTIIACIQFVLHLHSCRWPRYFTAACSPNSKQEGSAASCCTCPLLLLPRGQQHPWTEKTRAWKPDCL